MRQGRPFIKGFAAGLIAGAVIGLGIATSPMAKADADADAVRYAAKYGIAVCLTLDDYPSNAGILGIASSIHDDGLSWYQAGEVITLSVYDVCPRHQRLVDRFMATYARQAA